MNRPPHSVYFASTPNEKIKDNLIFVNAAGWIHSSPNFIIDRKNFYDYLIMYVISGKLIVEQFDQKHIINPGEAILLSLYHYHKYYSSQKYPCEILWIHFGGIEKQTLFNLIGSLSKNVVICNSPNTIPATLKRCLELLKNATLGYEHYLSLSIYELLVEMSYLFMYKQDESEMISNATRIVTLTDNFIRNNMNHQITLRMLSLNVQLSQFHYSRLFKKATGISPKQYLIQKKLEMSKYFLLYTNKTLIEIAEELNFSDQAHFSRVFKNEEGICPSNFRKKYLNKIVD